MEKNQPITMLGIEHFDWVILPLLLPTPTMQFSVDHNRLSHKRNRCSASDSDILIFTRSYGSALLITTPTPTPSLVKNQPEEGILNLREKFFLKFELVN